MVCFILSLDTIYINKGISLQKTFRFYLDIRFRCYIEVFFRIGHFLQQNVLMFSTMKIRSARKHPAPQMTKSGIKMIKLVK